MASMCGYKHRKFKLLPCQPVSNCRQHVWADFFIQFFSVFGGSEVMTILPSTVRAAQKANCGFEQLSSFRSVHIFLG